MAKQKNLMILQGESLMIKMILDKLRATESSRINFIDSSGSSNPKPNEKTLNEILADTSLDDDQRKEEEMKLPQRAFVISVGAGDEFIVVDNTKDKIIPEELYETNRKLFNYTVELINVTTLPLGRELSEGKQKAEKRSWSIKNLLSRS